MRFEIDSDIRRAWTLPSEFYTESGWFELSKEKIFARSWQFAGFSPEIDNLKPVRLLPEFLDEELLLTRENDVLRCLSNVCTHRGKILVEEPCRADLIRCRYHGRRFSIGGSFLSMPEFDEAEDFPSGDDDLARIEIDEMIGFLFVSLNPSAPLSVFLGDAISRLPEIKYPQMRHISSRSYEVNAHWALYCENYLEGFHIPFVHRALNEIVDYGNYSTETFRYSSLQTAFPARTGSADSNTAGTRFEATADSTNGGASAYYLFVFPNLMFNFYPWGISVNVVKPVAPEKTVVEFLTFVSDEEKLGGGAGSDLHRVEMEDEAVVESVQRGIKSRFYSRGRYSPKSERGLHHFHRLIAEFLDS